MDKICSASDESLFVDSPLLTSVVSRHSLVLLVNVSVVAVRDQQTHKFDRIVST